MAVNAHVGDVGTVLRVTVTDEDAAVVNLAPATLLEILLQKPDQSVLTRAASLTTDGADGRMQYATVAGDLDQHGTWRIQGRVTFGADVWHGEVAKFKVATNLA